MQKKCIWIINEYAGSPYHGMEFRHYYLGKELIKRGYKVYIITASYSHLLRNPKNLKGNVETENINGVNYVWIKVRKYNNSFSVGRLLKWLQFSFKLYHYLKSNFIEKLNISRPNYIITSTPEIFHLIPSRNLAKFYSAKFIYEVRDIWPLSLIEIGNLSPRNPLILLMNFIEKQTYKFADGVISLLPNFEDYIKENKINISKLEIIPNGISLEELKNIENEDISDLLSFVPKNKFTIAYAGNFGVANALDTLIEAAKLLNDKKNIHFILIGKGPEEKKLKELVKNYKLNNISFLPPQPKRKVLKFLKEYVNICYIGLKKKSIFKFGVSPNKLFDYMFVEKPIIWSISSANKPVDEAKCGISVEAENPKEVVKAILKLYSLPKDKLLEMGRNGKQYLLKYHTYDKLADKLERFLVDIDKS